MTLEHTSLSREVKQTAQDAATLTISGHYLQPSKNSRL